MNWYNIIILNYFYTYLKFYYKFINVTIDGKQIIKWFLNYNDDNMQLIPSGSGLYFFTKSSPIKPSYGASSPDQIDIECLNKAIELCSNRNNRLLLKKDPPFPNRPTVGINTFTVIINLDRV